MHDLNILPIAKLSPLPLRLKREPHSTKQRPIGELRATRRLRVRPMLSVPEGLEN